MQSEWIEIKEGCKMPDVETEVLVIHVDNDDPIQTQARIIREHWFSQTGNDFIFDVTHWKPLDWPAPPSTESETK